MEKASLATLQSGVGLVAGIMSIAGALYSAVQYVKPPTGELVTVVSAAQGDGPISAATVEVLTPQEALVATLTPASDGRARHELSEGAYVVKVTAPRFEPQTRPVQVQRGGTAEIRFRLAAPSATAGVRRTSGPARVVDKGVGAAERFFRGLGF